MTITVNLHHPRPVIIHNTDTYAAIRIPNTDADVLAGVTVFFAGLDDAYAWLADVIGKVQAARIEAANDQPPASTTPPPGYLEDYEPTADLDDDEPEWRTRARIESDLAVIIVRTQAELDAALAAGEPSITIDSPAGVWLTLRSSGSSSVVARGSSRVVAWGSSSVEARESSHVVAWGSSRVEASPAVAVHLHSAHATVTGGVVIDITALDLTDPQTWCDHHGATVTDVTVTLYKALDANLQAGHTYGPPVTYAVGTTVTAADYTATNACGGGLHLGPTTSCATAYRPNATRWVRCEVPLAELLPILDSTPKVKVRECRVVAECDRYGVDLAVQP